MNRNHIRWALLLLQQLAYQIGRCLGIRFVTFVSLPRSYILNSSSYHHHCLFTRARITLNRPISLLGSFFASSSFARL